MFFLAWLIIIGYFSIVIIFLVAISAILTHIIRLISLRINFVDKPGERKIHKKPIAYGGGLAMFIAFLVGIIFFVEPSRQIIALLISGAFLVFVGLWDDRENLPAWFKLILQIIAVLILIVGGVGVDFITNPIGGQIQLNNWAIPFCSGRYHFVPLTDLFTLVWVVLMINTMNFLDGLDGLAGGVSAIGGLIIFGLSLIILPHQPQTATLAIVLVGACLGFLVFNFHPAKIFMGDAGSQFLGLTLATLAIIAGSKIATTLMVLGLPILDLFWVAVRRISSRQSPFKADKLHFHHRLLQLGLTQKQAVFLVYGFCAVFGGLALMLTSSEKLWALLVMAAIMILLSIYIVKKTFNQKNHV